MQHDLQSIEYKGDLTGLAKIQNEKGEKLTVEKRGLTQSQKLRFQIMNSNEDEKLDDEEYYQKTMTLLRHFFNPYIRDYLAKLEKLENEGKL